MSTTPLPPLSLEDVIITTYCALDDALKKAGVPWIDGKLLHRRGPPPVVDDREVLCLALLQEILGFESDNAFHLWLDCRPEIQTLFPRRLSRQKFADRRALLTPLMQALCAAFCDLSGEKDPPFASSTAIPWTSATSSAPTAKRSVRPCPSWPKKATAPL